MGGINKLSKQKKIIIQFNEANFGLIKNYVEEYNLSGLKKIFNLPFQKKTSSESYYEYLEPWIQWYSFYSNLRYEDHKVFHLGDCLKNNHKIFLDDLSESKIGVFGSMNLKPSEKYSLYIPDPWTEVESDNSFESKLVSRTLKKLVNDNSQLKLNFKSLIGIFLIIGIPNLKNDLLVLLFSIISFIRKKRSILASSFDYLFGNYSLKKIKKNKFDFSMIFLNGFAHIQHHYLLNSKFVKGQNPTWYCKANEDPILDSLKIYNYLFDKIFREYEKSHEIWIITGLTQVASDKPVVYWRFKDHKKILKEFFTFKFTVYPRMTRDFEVEIDNEKDFKFAVDFFEKAKIFNGEKYSKAFGYTDFSKKNRIFTTLMYDEDVDNVELIWKNKKFNLSNKLSFVALKNGIHYSDGWVFSNSKKNFSSNTQIPIWELSKLVI